MADLSKHNNLLNDAFDNEYNSAGDYDELPDQNYQVRFIEADITEAKSSGLPMAVLKFEVTAGKYEGRYIWVRFMLHKGFGVKNCDTFLTKLDSGHIVQFPKDFNAYLEMIQRVQAATIEYDLQYSLEVKTNAKGYKNYDIKQVFKG